MWSRSQLKGRAKVTFKQNYWKCVLISLLLTLIAGGSGFASGNAGSYFNNSQNKSENYQNYEDFDNSDVNQNPLEQFNQGFEEGFKDSQGILNNSAGVMALAIGFGIFVIIFLVIMVLIILVDAFIINPFEVGCRRFFVRNLNEPAQVGNVGYGFDNNYKNVAKTMFFRDLFTILWSLLFIIPGIVKAYEYMMIPYLLADNPQMTKEQAFAESKQMMKGQKWKAFVLDLSFIGWYLLSALTLGILAIFYVNPYVNATHAALYEALRYENPVNQGTVYQNNPMDASFPQEKA